MSVENDAPTGSGFRKSLRLLVTTAKASPAASDWLFFEQALEGQDLQRIAKGTASAQQLTVSFWVKSNRTGTFCVTLTDSDNLREVSAQYTVSASATWERKTITFPADTTGAFDNDNASSLSLRFGLAIGSDRSSGTLPSTWQASVTANLFVGQTNLAASVNNYWQITGVQLEVGPVASAFEFKSYGQELRECQRYYYRTRNSSETRFGAGFNRSTTLTSMIVPFPVTMRADPTALEQSGVATDYSVAFLATAATCTVVPAFRYATANGAEVTFTVAAVLTAGQGSVGYSSAGASGYLGWSAEL